MFRTGFGGSGSAVAAGKDTTVVCDDDDIIIVVFVVFVLASNLRFGGNVNAMLCYACSSELKDRLDWWLLFVSLTRKRERERESRLIAK